MRIKEILPRQRHPGDEVRRLRRDRARILSGTRAEVSRERGGLMTLRRVEIRLPEDTLHAIRERCAYDEPITVGDDSRRERRKRKKPKPVADWIREAIGEKIHRARMARRRHEPRDL